MRIEMEQLMGQDTQIDEQFEETYLGRCYIYFLSFLCFEFSPRM